MLLLNKILGPINEKFVNVIIYYKFLNLSVKIRFKLHLFIIYIC